MSETLHHSDIDAPVGPHGDEAARRLQAQIDNLAEQVRLVAHGTTQQGHVLALEGERRLLAAGGQR
jgi:hypothetical protein